MSLNELPYEEYKGWYIGQGITMPAQGVYEINIYSDILKCAREEPDHIVGSVEEARRWIDEQESRLGATVWEEVKHGSYIVFTNLDTGETRQYYNAYPPDSSEAVSAAMMLKPFLEQRWGKNVKFEIIPIPEGG